MTSYDLIAYLESMRVLPAHNANDVLIAIIPPVNGIAHVCFVVGDFLTVPTNWRWLPFLAPVLPPLIIDFDTKLLLIRGRRAGRRQVLRWNSTYCQWLQIIESFSYLLKGGRSHNDFLLWGRYRIQNRWIN